jgi:cytidyltransferase-like protein
MSESHSKPKVLVAGFFDMLHSGHIRFFEEAAKYGRVIVSLGSDDNSLQSKGKKPVFSEEERKYMVESIKHVHKAYVPQSTSTLNFTCVAEAINPDFLVINEDGDTIEKREI